VAAVDKVVEGVRGGRLLAALLDLTEADIVDDEELGARPTLETAGVGAVGEAGVQVVEEIDAACVAHAEALLAGAQGEGLEEMALARAVLAGDHEVVVATHEVEAGELEHESLVEAGLEVPVERLERLALDEAAGVDAPRDALLELVGGLDAEDVLEQRGRAGALAGRPRQPVVELVARAGQSEEVEVSPESFADEVVVAASAISRWGSVGAGSLGHSVASFGGDRDAEVSGRRSYSVRSRGAMRA